jgi:PAS domain S-box-containing protein
MRVETLRNGQAYVLETHHLFDPDELSIGILCDRIRDAIVVTDTQDGSIVLWNHAAGDTFGYSPHEAREMRVRDLVPERMREAHDMGLSRYYQHTAHPRYVDHHKTLELPGLHAAGHEIVIEMTLSRVADADEQGGPYVMAIIRDVTEKKRLEELSAQLLNAYSGQATNSSVIPPQAPEGIPRDPYKVNKGLARRLTDQELAVLRCIVNGYSNPQIAKNLHLSTSTIKTYVQRITRKLGTSDRTQAAVKAVMIGLVVKDHMDDRTHSTN